MVDVICPCGNLVTGASKQGRPRKFCTACRNPRVGLTMTPRRDGKKCGLADCGYPLWSRGYCSRHYQERIAKPSGKSCTYYAITCAGCGNEAKVRRKGSRFCSVRCYNVSVGNQVDVERSQAYRDKRRRERISRRARENGAYRAEVDPRDVFKADGYRCHLCGRKCDQGKEVPHPKAPTVDHVVPLSAGGDHGPANCRTACFRCNNSKGNRGGGEQFAFQLAI